ncbi:hypothetical protein [Mesorhizobium sp. WSM3876]|uniref:hypothetical protein n=1 Tax=Mesorhizobium sp. WSM3876 TaxID=422277 RepID=UPI000BAFC495|nr:hypothetical protein [Mesorhizobium sp. WSM3876]
MAFGEFDRVLLVSERASDHMLVRLLDEDVSLVVDLGYGDSISIELYPVRVSLRLGIDKQLPRTIYSCSR